MKRVVFLALSVGLTGVVFMMLRLRPDLEQRSGRPNRGVVGLGSSQQKPNAPTTSTPVAGASQQFGGASQSILGRTNGAAASAHGLNSGAGPGDGSRRRRVWDPKFLGTLNTAVAGGEIQFDLIDGQRASGRIDRLESSESEVNFISGNLSEPETGRFFFHKQSLAGVSGDFVGVVEFPGSRRAYRLEPGATPGQSDLVECALGSVKCIEMPQPDVRIGSPPQNIPPLAPRDFPDVPIPDYQEGIVVLESMPDARAVVYLDFQGGYTPTWGGITYERPGFSNDQIFDVWQRVSEDFMPFTINVTTDLKVYQDAPLNSRQRVIVTPTDSAQPGAGGVAYVGSFNWTTETPCWVFVLNSPKFCAQACAHEAGHTLGLNHDGRFANGVYEEYYFGHGDGDTGWAPTMGVGFYENVTQWCKGEYANANNLQDQLAILASQNNVGYRPDDTGDMLATSRYLETFADGSVSAEGVIETTGDTDAFQFTTGGGSISLRAVPVSLSPNLAVEVAIYDSNDTEIVVNNPVTSLVASIATNLSPGTYTFRVTGAGRNDPRTNGFSNYGSLGYYSITGAIASARLPTRFSIVENSSAGTVVGVVPVAGDSGTNLDFKITSGNVSNTFSIDNLGVLTVADPATLDYEALARGTQLPVQYELLVDIVNRDDPALTERGRRVVVAVADVNEPPRITGMWVSFFFDLLNLPGGPVLGPLPLANTKAFGLVTCLDTECSFRVSVLEHSQSGTFVGRMNGVDPDRHTFLSYSIASGNEDGLFSINSESGEITVAGDLDPTVRNTYDLTVVLSDQTTPMPLTATSHVVVTVELPYPRGVVPYTVYDGISGALVQDLTNHISFPQDPSSEKLVTSFEDDGHAGDNYGAAMRGYLLPPASGEYTFWIASKDNGELWLSSSTNAAEAIRIAEVSGAGAGTARREWTKYSSQRSVPISLAAGHAYYIEARLKVASGPGNLAVAWESISNNLQQEVIPGQYLSPYAVNYLPHLDGFSAYLHEGTVRGAQIGRASVTDINKTDRLNISIVGGNEEGLFAIDPGTGAVTLTRDFQLSGASPTHYSLQLQAWDSGTPPLTAATTVTIDVVPTNAILATTLQQEIWSRIGTDENLEQFTNRPEFPKRPDALRETFGLSSTGPFGTNYGSRVRAFLTPTNSGPFTFYISSSAKESRLKFSPSTNSGDATIVAWVTSGTGVTEWDRFSSQKSGFIWLEAGRPCYLEVLRRQTGADDHFEVGWTGPGLAGTNIIDGSFLSLVDIGYAPELTGTNVNLSIDSTNGTLVYAMSAADSPMDSIAYSIVSGNLSNIFAIEALTGRITIADNSVLRADAITNFNLVIQAQDSGYGGLYPPKSSVVTVNVAVVDTSPPSVWTGKATDANWSTATNWNSGTPGERRKLIFNGYLGQTNYNDLLLKAGTVTINNGGFYIHGNSLALNGGIVGRGNATWAINSSLEGAQSFISALGTLSVAGSVNNNGYDLTLQANSALRVDGSIYGAGGLIKSSLGRATLTVSNAYTGPTTISAGTLALADAGDISQSSSIILQRLQYPAVLDGSALAGRFTIPTNQVLRGWGWVVGPVTIEGTLNLISPSAYIPLIVTNRLSLAGTTILRAFRVGTQETNWVLQVVGELHCGGNLVVTNSNFGSPSIRLGDTFKLFEAEQFSGAFTNIVLPKLAKGLAWATNRLTVDGTIRVSIAPTQVLVATFTGRSMVLRFNSVTGVNYAIESSTHLEPDPDWTVLSQRAGTGSTISVLLNLDPADTRRFFRLRAY